MNWRIRWLIVGLVALLNIVGCNEAAMDSASSATTDSARTSSKPRYSEAELARRQAALDLYYEKIDTMPPAHQASRPLKFVCFGVEDATEEDIRTILEPFKDEIETIFLYGASLTPEFLGYFREFPNLDYLKVEGTNLTAKDFSGVDLHHVKSVSVRPSMGSAHLWMTPDEELTFTDWATSEDGKMSVRLFVESAPQPADQPMWSGVELRNNTDKALCVYSARRKQSLQEIQGPDGVLEYVPPEPDWVDSSRTSAWPRKRIPNILVHAQTTYREKFSLPLENWPGTDEPGSYTVNYRYRSSIGQGNMAKVAQRYRVDVDALETWNGDVPSLPITIERAAGEEESTRERR